MMRTTAPPAASGGVAIRPRLGIVAWILALGLVLGSLVPPFQSPDEFDHVKRAWLVSHGVWMLDTPAGSSSGGAIDTGLLAYMDHWRPLPFQPTIKASAEERRLAATIPWSGVREFSTAPGTGYYFPLVYAPHAIGLVTGEALGLTVAASYTLARAAVLTTIGVLLAVAFAVYPTNPLAVALLVLPMSAFQAVSASLDGVTTALAVLTLALCLRVERDREHAAPAMVTALTASVFVLASSRVHLLPLLAPAFVAVRATGSPRHLAALSVATLAVLAWIVVAIRHTVDTRVPLGGSPAGIALWYLKDPFEFLRLVGATLTHEGRLASYRDEFIGVLGWLDARLGHGTYVAATMLLGGIALLTPAGNRDRGTAVVRALFAAGAVGSVLLVFFALLIAWNPPPVTVIQGVQGRYFLIPALMLAYAIAGDAAPAHGLRRKLALLLVGALAAIGALRVPDLLLERYFVRAGQEVLLAPGRPWIASPIPLARSAIHDLVPMEPGGRWRPTGPQPAFAFASPEPFEARDARILLLRFECEGPAQPVAMRLSWRSVEGTYSPAASLTLELRPGDWGIQVSPHSAWMRAGRIAEIRIAPESPDACRSMLIDAVEIGRFEWR